MLKEGQKYVICWLVEPDETIPLVDFLLELKQVKSEFAATAVAHLKRARHPGNHGKPLTEALKGKLKGILEVRAKTPHGYVRMPFVFTEGQRIIVLMGVVKKTKSFDSKTEKAILRAHKRLINEEAGYEEIDFSIFE